MKHPERLATLTSLGWTCEHSEARHMPEGHDKKVRRSVYLEGLINAVPQCIFLAVEDGLVMVLRGKDYEFEAFVEMCRTGVDPDAPVEVKAVRGLFDSE